MNFYKEDGIFKAQTKQLSKNKQMSISIKGGDKGLLNTNEQRVLEYIQENPFITQNEIAEAMNISRSTVASTIASLTQKNYLLGRAYIINEESKVYCIGAMNVDRKYYLENELVLGTSNPVTSSVSVGGVARNIAENLGRLEADVSLISLGGHDQDFQIVKKETEAYVNMQNVMQKNGVATGAYNAILDPQGEMQMAIADMQIYEEMTGEWISSYFNQLREAELLVLDLNLPYEVVEYILSIARKFDVDLFVIPVSGPKMNRLPTDLSGVTWLIVNQDESETFFDVTCEDDADFERLADRWLDLGVENIVITRGSKASIYGNKEGKRHAFTPPAVEQVVDVTGAGDSYASGIIYGYLQKLEPIEAIHLGMTNSYYTIQSSKTVRTELSPEKLNEEKNNLFTKEK